jgi:hypothetical protein
VRYPPFYGLLGRDLGLNFKFDYKFYFASPSISADIFKHLRRLGVEGPITAFQQLYNDNVNNILDVTDPVLYIDAPSTEKLLKQHARSVLGIDVDHSYTLFFINWYGQENFKFHVYTKTDEPDPDTGYNFGELRGSRKMVAWGGTHGRTWFYDFSAGPESWAYNYDVDNSDVDGDGVDDYIIPVIWEYDAAGYRDPSQLSNDVALLTRIVGIDLLFTTSPLYDPLVTAPALGGDKVVHIEMFEDEPGFNGLDWIDTGVTYDELKSFQPYYSWQVNLEDNNPIQPEVQRALQIFSGVLVEDDCWNGFGATFAELFCFFDANLSAYVPAYDDADYVGEVFAFNTTADTLGDQFGLLGFADDNWVDGTQTYVFQFDADDYRQLGYGFTTTTIHEFGHHIGMSHPHDGYDFELDVDFGPGGPSIFAWLGDESHTVMSYNALANGFGQFDRDNMYRYEFAGYINWSNDLLADIQAAPGAGSVSGLVNTAKSKARIAIAAFNDWNYLRAARNARSAYDALSRAAERLGIVTPSALYRALNALPGVAQHRPEGDPIRFPDE